MFVCYLYPFAEMRPLCFPVRGVVFLGSSDLIVVCTSSMYVCCNVSPMGLFNEFSQYPRRTHKCSRMYAHTLAIDTIISYSATKLDLNRPIMDYPFRDLSHRC